MKPVPAGTPIRCVEAVGDLRAGQVYIVRASFTGHVLVVGVIGAYCWRRFAKVQTNQGDD